LVKWLTETCSVEGEWVWSSGRMILIGENEVLGEKPLPMPLCLPHIPHGLAWDWTEPLPSVCGHSPPKPWHGPFLQHPSMFPGVGPTSHHTPSLWYVKWLDILIAASDDMERLTQCTVVHLSVCLSVCLSHSLPQLTLRTTWQPLRQDFSMTTV
jgi:hypothetical protein